MLELTVQLILVTGESCLLEHRGDQGGTIGPVAVDRCSSYARFLRQTLERQGICPTFEEQPERRAQNGRVCAFGGAGWATGPTLADAHVFLLTEKFALHIVAGIY